jgi:hypothetical protein
MNALILPTTELRLVDTDGMCCDTSQATSAFLRLLGFLDPAEAGRYGYRTPSPVAHNLVARCTHKPYSPPRTMRSLSHPLRKRSPAPLCGAGGTSAVALGAAGESARPFHLHHRSISRDAPGAQRPVPPGGAGGYPKSTRSRFYHIPSLRNQPSAPPGGTGRCAPGASREIERWCG